MTVIIGLKIEDRAQDAIKFQEILTKLGCDIRTRIGLHPTGEYKCNNSGIILLEVISNVNVVYDTLAKYWTLQVMKF